MWQPRARDAGFDPKRVRDAAPDETFTIEIEPKTLKGSVIGDPEQCVGAKCARAETGATWAWVGVQTAILGFPDGSLVRFAHDGKVPTIQDTAYWELGGSYVFKQPRPGNAMGARSARRKRNEKGGADKKGKGQRKRATAVVSLAAQFRH